MLYLDIALLLVASIGTRYRREYRYLLVVGVAGLVAGLLLQRDRFVAFTMPWSLVFAVSLAGLVVDIAWLWVIRRTTPTRDDAWRFDQSLDTATRALTARFREMPNRSDEAWPGWRRQTLDAGRPLIKRMAELKAPTTEWRAVASAYAAAYRDLLDALEEGRELPIEEFNRQSSGIDAQMLELRSQYRGDGPRSARPTG